MKRGLTLIELLIALGMFSVLTIAIAMWIQVAVRCSAESVRPLRWQAAAEAVLQLVHDDLASGDFDSLSQDKKPVPRIQVSDSNLIVRTRDGGTVKHQIQMDRLQHDLVLRTTDSQNRTQSRLLLQNVSAWDCTIDDETKKLTVAISDPTGRTLTRSYLIP